MDAYQKPSRQTKCTQSHGHQVFVLLVWNFNVSTQLLSMVQLMKTIYLQGQVLFSFTFSWQTGCSETHWNDHTVRRTQSLCVRGRKHKHEEQITFAYVRYGKQPDGKEWICLKVELNNDELIDVCISKQLFIHHSAGNKINIVCSSGSNMTDIRVSAPFMTNFQSFLKPNSVLCASISLHQCAADS